MNHRLGRERRLPSPIRISAGDALSSQPMMVFSNNAEFFAALRSLIDSCCERRALKPLSRLLGPYLAFNGLTDSWGDILIALKAVCAHCREDISETELETMEALIRAAEEVVRRGLNPNAWRTN
jgi:hypothetical protein